MITVLLMYRCRYNEIYLLIIVLVIVIVIVIFFCKKKYYLISITQISQILLITYK